MEIEPIDLETKRNRIRAMTALEKCKERESNMEDKVTVWDSEQRVHFIMSRKKAIKKGYIKE